MFGTTKVKSKGKTFYYTGRYGNKTIIYSAKGKQLISFESIYSICSVTIMQSFSVGYELTKREKEILGIALNYILSSRGLLVTIQNVTKNTYDALISGGFIDYARLPGSYTSGVGSMKSAKIPECLALMVKSTRALTPGMKTTLKLLKNLNP